MKLIIITFCCCWFAAALYQPRGWRPNGRPFRYQQLPQNYGTPFVPKSTTLIPATTTARTPTAATTTPKSREPTTPTIQISASSAEEDFETNTGTPLAIANSFAFNRPIYVYNAGYPFQPAYAILQ